MQWWIVEAGITQGPSSLAGNPLYAGPYRTKAEARAAFKAGVRPGGSSGGNPPVQAVLTNKSTFGQVKNYIDSKAPGYGDKWIAWVETHEKVVPPYPNKVNLSSNTFGPPNPPPSPAGNTALDWFAAWLLIGNVGPGIARLLAGAIGDIGKRIQTQILPGVAAGVSPYQGGILGFLGALQDPHTWLRVAEVAVGVILLAVGLNALLKQTTGTSPVQVVGKIADKVPKVIPV